MTVAFFFVIASFLAGGPSEALGDRVPIPSARGQEAPAQGPQARVRATEQAFAQTMADRDHEAFTSFLSEETIFFSGPTPIRGKEAVAAAWRPYFEGPQAPFSWAPEGVHVLESGTLAISFGPVKNPEGKVVGTFNSIWRLEADGEWRIIFDKGCPLSGE